MMRLYGACWSFWHRIRHIRRKLCPGLHGGAWGVDGSFSETQSFGR
jgi:hypothetical protein